MSGESILRDLSLVHEVGLLRADRSGVFCVIEDPSELARLDAPRAEFCRVALGDWVMGRLGLESERLIPQAIGLDESWRQAVLALDWHGEIDRLPAWMMHEGVETQLTGAGFLRTMEGNTPERLLVELSVVNSYVWGLKIAWLDVMSFLDGQRWYPVAMIQELLALLAALSLFEVMANVLDMPGSSHYLPVQRATFLQEPSHAEAFDAWCIQILEHVLVPLGVATIEGSTVRFRTRDLRVVSPPGMPDEYRAQLVRDLFNDPDLPFLNEPEGGARAALSLAPTPTLVEAANEEQEPAPEGGEHLQIEAPAERLLDAQRGRDVVRYDGAAMTVVGNVTG